MMGQPNGQGGNASPRVVRAMRLKAITFEFWSTLVDGNITPARTAERLARLHAAIVGAGHACTPDELRVGFERAFERITADARETLRDVGHQGAGRSWQK